MQNFDDQMMTAALKQQAAEALMRLRRKQTQDEIGVITQEREAEVMKEIEGLDKSKKSGKQAGTAGLGGGQDIMAQLAMSRMG